ncbi:hypothetical protein PYCCODRAFT_1472810, partial [Trametes coccinea BRFM310]
GLHRTAARNRPSTTPSVVPRDRGLVVVPPGLQLTSMVTYSNLPGGYEQAATQREDTPVMWGDERVLIPRRWIRFLENPDSIAVLIVHPSAEGEYRPSVVITHQKLRLLFKDAVEWYLKNQGVQGHDVLGTFVSVNHEPDDYILDLHPQMGSMQVVGDGYDFFTPTPEVIFSTPVIATVATSFIVALAFVLGSLVYWTIISAADSLSQARAAAVPPSVSPMRVVADGINAVQEQAKALALRGLGRGIKRLDEILAQVRQFGEL